MLLDDDVIGRLAASQGLVRVSLFEAGRGPGGGHDVLLDGPRGSFAISDAGSAPSLPDATSWAWSANVPHHVSLAGSSLTAVRWDRPSETRELALDAALAEPDLLARFLKVDALDTTRSIVAQSLGLFRAVRSVVAQRHGGDDDAVETYLAALDALAGVEPGTDPHAFADPDRARRFLADPALRTALADFGTAEVRGTSLRAWSSLSVRHASGPIFQEAHHELVSVPTRDLFGGVRPVTARVTRGGVHFTPPTLARSLAEQAIRRLGDVNRRRELSVADFACGSGAFLVECVRALQRAGFAGALRVIGRDASALAVRMARYVLRHASADWGVRAPLTIEVTVGDALRDDLPHVDLVVMNPPFGAWVDVDRSLRSQVRDLVPEVGRPDLSMAFVARALDAVGRGGVLAAIVPARVLEGASSRPWREAVGGRFEVPVLAVFDDLTLFQHATVRIGAFVCTADRQGADTLSLHAGRDATGEALRALRRDPDWRSGVSDRRGWSIRRVPAHVARSRGGGFSPAPDEAGPGTPSREGLSTAFGTVSDFFDPYQGIRSGLNGALVLRDADLRRLPEAERTLFRRAATSRGISDGRVVRHVNVFYPYDADGPTILDEQTLRRVAPVYHRLHLEPHRTALLARGRLRQGRWWLLAEWRPEFARRRPLLVSKYFLGPGGFALDEDGTGTVLQGFGWLPRGSLEGPLARSDDGAVPRLARAYLAMLNSSSFFDLLVRAAPGMRGGQRDVSRRHVAGVPMVDLSHPHLAGYVTPLAAYADVRYRGVGDPDGEPPPDDTRIERLVRELLDPRSHVAPSGAASPAEAMPSWMSEVLEAGRDERPRAVRSRLLGRLQDLVAADRMVEVDEVLDQVDVGSLHDLVLVTLVRGTFPFRAGLSRWVPFRNRVSAEFASRGHDVDDAMYGLF